MGLACTQSSYAHSQSGYPSNGATYSRYPRSSEAGTHVTFASPRPIHHSKPSGTMTPYRDSGVSSPANSDVDIPAHALLAPIEVINGSLHSHSVTNIVNSFLIQISLKLLLNKEDQLVNESALNRLVWRIMEQTRLKVLFVSEWTRDTKMS